MSRSRLFAAAVVATSGAVVLGLSSVPAVASPTAGRSAVASLVGAATHGKATPAAVLRRAGLKTFAHRPSVTGSVAANPSRAARLDPQTAHLIANTHGLVRVTVTGKAAAITAAAKSLGGRALVTGVGQTSVLVPKASLKSLAGSAGVSGVTVPVRAFTDSSGPSEGGFWSGANSWISAGKDGTGVKLAIVDAGFGTNQTEFNNEVTAGHLGTSPTVVNEGCTDGLGGSTPYEDAHGLQTAELAHQMAPNAQLFLYCVADSVGMNAAETDIEGVAGGIKIVSCSLAFPGDSRGDGTGAADSAAAAVEKARKHGILWVNSAGNQAADHWGGGMADTDHDGFVDIGGNGNVSPEEDAVFVAGGSVSEPTSVDTFLQWDGWPTSNIAVGFELDGWQCTGNFDGSANFCPGHTITTLTASQSSGSPVLELNTAGHANTSSFDQIWFVSVLVTANRPTLRYDLNYYGAVDGPSLLACSAADAQNNCIIDPISSSHSVAEPGDSPYAFTVGAATTSAQTDDTRAAGTLELFSSQGPTIDGRTKPDITGWDGVTSFLPEFPDGFYGTSAAAPIAAGAAADVASSNLTLDAAQIEAFIEQRADTGTTQNGGKPLNPPTNARGHGLLELGAAGTANPPTGGAYAAITPTRVLDTRAGTLPAGNKGALGAGGTRTVNLSTFVPPDATAVVINLTGTGVTSASTFLSAYPGGAAYPGTSNLNLAKATDGTAAVLAPVTLSAAKTITIRNQSGSTNVVVDLLGYFGTGAETGLYTPLPSTTNPRVLDTRGTLGGHKGKVTSSSPVTVHPNLPPGTTAAVVNVTAVGPTTSGFLSAAPHCSKSSSTLNVTKYTRANMAIVGLDSNGNFCISDSLSVDVVVDVLGSFGPTGSAYIALNSPVRILDTRTGNNGQTAQHPVALGAAKSEAAYAGGLGEIPFDSTGLFTDVVEANSTLGGFLTAFPGVTKPATTASTVNFTPKRVVSNAAIVGLASDEFGLFNNTGTTNAAVDVFGYFFPTS